MQINSIVNGIVIDHIRAGHGMRVLKYLKAESKSDTVAYIMNAVSEKHGRKDIIKLENVADIDRTALGLLEHNATVDIIRNGKITQKDKLSRPEMVVDVIKCKNPRCVTSTEQVTHVFHATEKDGSYRCEYCDEIVQADRIREL